MRSGPQYVPPSSPVVLTNPCVDRTFITNIPTLETPPHANLHALVKSLNPPLFVENSPNPYAKIPSTMAEDDEWYGESELFLAVDLMKRCLDLDGTRRCESLLSLSLSGAVGMRLMRERRDGGGVP